MSKRKGVSAAEKRERVLTQLRESKRPWTTKELEKSAKKLGFHPMAMGDVLQSLIDDSLAVKEKIGSSNYVWSFPSDAFKSASKRLKTLSEQVESTEEHISKLEEEKTALEPGREKTDEYLALQDELRTKKARLEAVDAELSANRANDPEVLKELDSVVQQIKGSVNRETDNTFAIASHLIKKKNMDRKTVHNYLGISDSFDYI